jgi:hypothetical protein
VAISAASAQRPGPAREPGDTAACRADNAGEVVCEAGGRRLRMIEGSASPSLRYAVFWGVPDRQGGDQTIERADDGTFSAKDVDAVENYLVRLSDARILTTLPGKHFGDRKSYNHTEHLAMWSRDSREVMVVNANKWSTDAGNVYRIVDDDRVLIPLNIANVCRAAALAYLMVEGKQQGRQVMLDDYLTRFDPQSLDDDGTIAGGCALVKPKQDEKDFQLRFRAAAEGGRLAGKLLSIDPMPDDDHPDAAPLGPSASRQDKTDVVLADAHGVVLPEKGSPLAEKLLAVARPAFEAEVTGRVEFSVHRLRVLQDWCFGEVGLRRPGGRPIDWHRTKFRDARTAGLFFPEHSMFLLHQSSGRWRPVEHVVGPEEPVWENWLASHHLPRALFE